MDKPRILVVDDEPRAVGLLVRSLRRLGDVETAASGDEAWRKFSPGAFDLIVSDQRMPGMSGVELLAKVAEQDENVGCILLTGYSDMDSTVDSINRGRVHAYLHKPCSPPDLEEAVRGVLVRVGLARENRRLVSITVEQNHALQEALAELERSQSQLLASERLSAVGKTIATIVHDLRGPLAAIQGLAQIARDQEETASELLAEILQETQRMARMCEELLEVTRVSKCPLAPVDLQVDALLSKAVAPYLELAGCAGIHVGLHGAPGLQLRGDEDQLLRALRNLLQNAVEEMPQGGTLEVAARGFDERVELSVADSGRGISEEIQDRLFEPFVTEGKSQGNGLGLAIVESVVRDHAGSVRVEKSEAGGACFVISLPSD
ncbi:MAG: hybrid sensor histidine kinase/response regulator [bacterium]|nr:hybrid sensor histidine kinase/response regulator [bacterium]